MQDCADRRELLDRLEALRAYINEEIAAAALVAEPTKTCARSLAGLQDACSNLAAVLSR